MAGSTRNIPKPLNYDQKIAILKSLFAPVDDQKDMYTFGQKGCIQVTLAALPATPATFLAMAAKLSDKETAVLINEITRYFPIEALKFKLDLVETICAEARVQAITDIEEQLQCISDDKKQNVQNFGVEIAGFSTLDEYEIFKQQVSELVTFCAIKKERCLLDDLESLFNPETPFDDSPTSAASPFSASDEEHKRPPNPHSRFLFSAAHVAHSKATKQPVTAPRLTFTHKS